MAIDPPSHLVAALAERFHLALKGPADVRVDGVGTLAHATHRQVAFLANPRYASQLAGSRAAAVVVAADMADKVPGTALIAPDPYVAYAKIAALFEKRPAATPGIHPTAVVAAGATVDPTASVGPFTVIEAGAHVAAGAVVGPHCCIGTRCTVGAQSRLVARVTLVADVKLGKRVLIHPGAVLGADGFGLAVDGDHWLKVPQLGGVHVGDDCEIGANTTIDRGALEDTVLEEDVHLDNLIQIAHNVHIGAHTAMAGCSAAAGSARIGRWCMVGGNAGILGHLEVADHVVITAKSLVTHSIHAPGQYASGVPLEESRAWRKNAARFKQLDTIARRLAALERKTHE